jgi:hypothetical protein
VSITKWVDYGVSIREVGRLIDFLKLYKNSRLISVKLVGDNYTVVYTSADKLTDNSHLYVGASCL